MKEIWRLSPSLSGVLVSSIGRLMIIPYHSQMPNGGTRQYGGEPTSGQWDGERFIYLHRGKTHKVHRLVCEAFNGPPVHGQVCMHKDENPRNNRPDNLKWGSQKENLNAPGFAAYRSDLESQFKHVRNNHGVPAKRGAKVVVRGKAGIVTSAVNGHIRVRFDGKRASSIHHPTSVEWADQGH